MKTKMSQTFAQTASWAALLVTVLGLAVVPAPVRAADQAVPFQATFVTTFEGQVTDQGKMVLEITGLGNATHLGATVAFTDNQTVDVNPNSPTLGSATATYTLTGAAGDTIVLEMAFDSQFTASGVEFSGIYEVTSGTGKFAGATGEGNLAGSASFTGPTVGAGQFVVIGTMSQPNAARRRSAISE